MVKYVKKQLLERFADTPSPSKNLTDQQVVPPIGKSRKFNRVTSRQSLHLEDIKLEKKSATEFGWPRPVDKIVVNVDKQKTVHFDDVVRIR